MLTYSGIYSEPARILPPLPPPSPGTALPGETWVSRILREFFTERSISAKTTRTEDTPVPVLTIPPQAATNSTGDPPAAPSTLAKSHVSPPLPPSPLVAEASDTPAVSSQSARKRPKRSATRRPRNQNTRSVPSPRDPGMPFEAHVATQQRSYIPAPQPTIQRTKNTAPSSRHHQHQHQQPGDTNAPDDNNGLALILQAIQVEREAYDGVEFE